MTEHEEVILDGKHTYTWTEYQFLPQDLEEWIAFYNKWHVPYGSAYTLKVHIGTYERVQYQRIMLTPLAQINGLLVLIKILHHAFKV